MPDAVPDDRLDFPLFGELTGADAAIIRPLLRRRAIAAGTTVFQRGDKVDTVYLVVSGLLRISVTSVDGRELAFRVVGPGEMVGELGVLDGQSCSADLMTLRPSVLMGLSQGALNNLMATRPTIATGIIRFLCRRLRETSEQLEALALQRIETRLARLLLRRVENAAIRGGEYELTLDLSQSDIAALIGASRPKVSVGFGELEKQGAIRRVGRKLVCRVAALNALAEMPDF